MKKILLFASALAGLFLAGSCQRENLEPQADKQVTFTIEAPAAMQTKAIADGLNVDQLIYEVWITGQSQKVTDLSGATKLYQAKTDKKTVADGKVSFKITLDLVNDQNFTVLFWAQNSANGVYKTDELTKVTYLENANVLANYANRDAFYGSAFVSDGATETPTVILKRPFAQVNLCTLNLKDTPKEGDYTITLDESKMTFTTVPYMFNIATGDASGEMRLEFAYNAVPGTGDNADTKDKTIKVNDKLYYYAGMNFVFADKNEGNTAKLEYDIQTKLNKTVEANVNNTIDQIPLKQNYRTNIVGNLLTSKVDYEIIVDADFNAPENVIGEEWTQTGDYTYAIKEGASAAALKEVLAHANAEAALAATKSEGPVVTIDLEGNVEWETGAGIGSTPLLPEDSPISAVVINGNGKTFTATGKGVGQVRLANGALLTFNNVKVVDHSVSYAENSWEYGYLEFGGKLAFDECEFGNAIMIESEIAAFTNCSFNSNHDNEYAVWVNEGITTFNGCTFVGARGLKIHEAYGSEVTSVVVEGCTFGTLTKKPGIALGTLNAETSVTIKNSLFIGCQPGDQNLYMYETDTDVTTFTFVNENNEVHANPNAMVQNWIENAQAGETVNIPAGEYTFPSGAFKAGVILNCAPGTVFTGTSGLNINGATVIGATFENKDGVAVSGTIYGTFKNCTFDGSEALRWCYSNDGKEVVFEDCEIKTDFRGFHFDGMDGNVIFRRCKINGFNAYGGEGTATFENCVFGNDESTYNGLNTYSNTVLTDCQFNFISGKTNFIDMEGTGKTLTITNCTATLDGVAKPVTDFVGGSKINNNTVILNGNECVLTAAQLTAALADETKNVITLAPGVTYEGTFHVLKEKQITSADPDNKAMIKGRVHVNSVNATFTNVNFDRNETNSNEPNNTASNALQYKAVVMIYGDQTHTIKFDGCNFYHNNGTHRSAITNVACDLIVDNCYFEGYSSSIYSQANLSVTNSTFNYTGGNNVILSINGCGANGGKVIFKNNNISGEKIFAMSQFLSTVDFGNGTYHFDVQGNTGAGFDYYFLNESRVANKTFAEGSVTF